MALDVSRPEVPKDVSSPPTAAKLVEGKIASLAAEPFSIDSSPLSNVGACVKLHLAHLELEAKEKAQEEE